MATAASTKSEHLWRSALTKVRPSSFSASTMRWVDQVSQLHPCPVTPHHHGVLAQE
ncbi:unnamed protein product, partial [Ectocarpus sp. 4 AP-2014]